jgi:chromosome condensin MukBEF ATPase and DNA-binding subunit MukB
MTIERDVGALDARMKTVEQEIHVIRSDVREIRDALVTARGGWRTLTIVVGISSTFGAVIAKLLPFLSMPRS